MLHKGEYIWALVGRFLPLFIYLVTTMILARYLSPDDFGMIGVLSIFFMVANTLMDAGLGGSLVKEKSLSKLDCSTIFVFNIAISLTLYLLLFAFADVIETYFETLGLAMVVRVLCLIFLINAWGLVPRSLLIRDLRFRTLTIINVVGVIAAAVSSVALAMLQFEVYALVAYQIVNALVTVLLSIRASRFVVSFRFSRSNLKRLLPFGIFTTLTTTIDTIYENLITFLFGKYLNMQQAGFLSQAKRLEEVPSQSVAQTISNVAFPVLTQLRNDGLRFAKECNNTFKSVLLLALPLLFTMSVFSEPIIWLVYGEQWRPAAPYLSLLIFAAVFHIAETLNRAFIKSTTQVAQLLNYTLIKRLLGIAAILVFLFVETKLALIGYILSTFVGFILNVHLLSRISEITIIGQVRLFLTVLLPSVIYYIIMCAVSANVDSLPMQIAVAVFLLVAYYLGVLRLYGMDLWNNAIRLLNNKKSKHAHYGQQGL